jgi:lipoprotein-releasing system permease protein
MLPYQVIIALRYLKSRKRHRSISFNTLITVLGVAVGVAALLIVLSVMSGFHADLQKKILGVRSHIVVQTYGRIMTEYEAVRQQALKEPHVVSASPFVIGQAMVSFEGIAQGVYMRGVDPKLEMETTDIEEHMQIGSLLDLREDDGDLPGIVIGNELSTRLALLPGDTVRIISPTGGTGPLGMIPRQKKFRVVGIFEIGMFEYDSNLVLTSLGPARQFFGIGEGVTGVELKVDAIYKVADIAEGLKENLGPNYLIQDWIQMNRSLFAALKLEKLAMFVILTLIVLVAAFNIVSTQIMNVIEKEREIAILKAMGASSGGIMSVFMLQGFLIGLLGTSIGISLGFGINYLIDTYELIKLPPDVYYLSHLPAKMKLVDFVAVSVSAVLISFVATIYPAWQAARLNPVEPLRYE